MVQGGSLLRLQGMMYEMSMAGRQLFTFSVNDLPNLCLESVISAWET